jgi:ribonuclease HI
MVKENALNIYTDGSSFSHPRAGGIGFRFVTIDKDGEEVARDFELPGYQGATNNQMELNACIEALKEALRNEDLHSVNSIVIYTDSRYIVDNHDTAIFEWPKSRWCNRAGRPVLNADLWKELFKLIKKSPCRINFVWVKGHSKDKHNRAVDKLAKASAKSPLNRPLTIVTVRRKTTEKSTEIGSVRMQGQSMIIRVITDEYLRVQRLYKYKYEVLSEESQYYGCVDTLFSKVLLKAGHHYEVTVNDNTANPTIVEVLRELERLNSVAP